MTPRALISVSDKTGIVELAQEFAAAGVEVVSTGGTRATLEQAGIAVTPVDEVTGFPEILDGRVKTLHPRIHAGLLARQDSASHMASLVEHGISPIDWLVVNLYPFAETVAQPEVTLAQAVEQIDIGGPAMLRAAAKNHLGVAVLVDAEDYAGAVARLRCGTMPNSRERLRLATKAFRHTAAYDATVANWMSQQVGDAFPERLTVTFRKVQDLRYGENPHQQAAFYAEVDPPASSIAGARQLHGKELSYNNINDANAALALVGEFDEPAAVAIKHTNPCGVGMGDTIEQAFVRAHESDPVSIFGGIVALNRPVDVATAGRLAGIFLEIVLAPSYEPAALELLQAKPNLRLLQVPATSAAERTGQRRSTVAVGGGLLLQDADDCDLLPEELRVVTQRAPTEAELRQLLFAWRVVKHVKSNAVVLAREACTVGVGAGQMNRVGAARVAIEQAGPRADGSVLASDAFFPMPDTVEAAAASGVRAIIQPGGSRNDAAAIAACDDAGIAMVFTGIRHFRH